MSSTAEMPGWYIEFQTAVLRQLPRPGRGLSKDVAMGWVDNQSALQKVLADSLLPPRWREQDDVIYFSVTSDGTTGPEWIERLEKKGRRLSERAKQVLHSPDFRPTSGVTTEIAILKGMLFEDRDRITSNVRDKASQRKLSAPNAEVACLIRENFSDEDIKAMGLVWITAMHEPIKDSDGDPHLLSARRDGDGSWLNAYCGRPDSRWGRGSGFAFVVSQVGAEGLVV